MTLLRVFKTFIKGIFYEEWYLIEQAWNISKTYTILSLLLINSIYLLIILLIFLLFLI